MAKGFKYRDISGFRDLKIGEKWVAYHQLKMPDVGDDDSPHSKVSYLGLSTHPDFFKYHVEHEMVRPYKVRFKDETRNSVIRIFEFDLFIAKNMIR